MPREAPKAGEATLEVDSLNEVVIVAAACASPELRRVLVSRVPSDYFHDPKNAAIWSAIRELERRHLGFDVATLATLSAGVDSTYLAQLIELRPAPPPNIEHHVRTLEWDRARVNVWIGPLQGLVTAMRDPRTEPDKVRALALQVARSFDGFGDRGLLLDPQQLVRDQMEDLRKRRAGAAIYPFGIRSLDDLVDQKTGKPLLIPGAAPGKITFITGVSGSGKSLMGAHFILGSVRQRRRVLVGAWEPQSGELLEFLACVSLKWSRSDVKLGRVTDEQFEQLREREEFISKWVRFLPNPFRRSTSRASNERNLDMIEGYLSDTGCDVFYADLWERALEEDSPSDEKRALYRQQEMMERSRCHGIFNHQQKLKDVEEREDKRPNRSTMKGSSAYVEVADNLFGTHRPALFKSVPDNKFELLVLKQRDGRWPIALEFEFDPDTAQIWSGREVPFGSSAESAGGQMEDFIAGPKREKKSWRRD